jgi:hypothetical protein
VSVLIEFIKDTEKRKKGERLTVDDNSAKSFVSRKKVAKRITEAQLKAEARKAAEGVADDLDEDEGETSESEESGETAEQSAGGAS